MKNIAYKVAQGIPNLPDGFVIEHYETNDDTVEGYLVVPKAQFQYILDNNIPLFRAFEAARGIVTGDPNAPPPLRRSNSEAQRVPQGS